MWKEVGKEILCILELGYSFADVTTKISCDCRKLVMENFTQLAGFLVANTEFRQVAIENSLYSCHSLVNTFQNVNRLIRSKIFVQVTVSINLKFVRLKLPKIL